MPNAPQTQPEFPPGYEARAQKIVEGSRQAGSVPLPGPLLEAFLPSPLTAAGFNLVDLTAGHIALLQRIGSPIFRELAELSKPEAEREVVPYDDTDMWELLFVMTRPAREARLGLKSNGSPGAFTEYALASTADQLPADVLADKPAILAALAANFARAFATRLAHQASSSGNDGTSFTPPPAAPMTASAGGLTM